MLYDEYSLLLSDQFLDQETGAVVEGDPVIVIRYIIHDEAVLFVLISMCGFMGTYSVFCQLATRT